MYGVTKVARHLKKMTNLSTTHIASASPKYSRRPSCFVRTSKGGRSNISRRVAVIAGVGQFGGGGGAAVAPGWRRCGHGGSLVAAVAQRRRQHGSAWLAEVWPRRQLGSGGDGCLAAVAAARRQWWQLGGSKKSAAVVWRHGSVTAAAVMAARQRWWRWQRQLCGCSGNLAAWQRIGGGDAASAVAGRW